MTISSDVQLLEPGAVWEGIELDATINGGGVVRFHSFPICDENGVAKSVTWQGDVYAPWPVAIQGFAKDSGQQPIPRVTVGNVDGSISRMCLSFDDLVGAKVTRHRTFTKYLDAVNFAGGNPTADPTQEFPLEDWFVERKSGEDYEKVEFELASPLDFNGVKLPRRQIVANQCPAQWVYRGIYCGYTGPAVADAMDVPTSDLALDRCGKRLSSCKLRVWPDDVLNYGGFAAAGLVRV